MKELAICLSQIGIKAGCLIRFSGGAVSQTKLNSIVIILRKGKIMIKLLSVTKSGLITGSFLSLSFIIEASFPVDAANLGTKIASSEDVPICYMETTGGQRLNLSYLCGKVSSPSTPKFSCNQTSNQKVTIKNVNYDGNVFEGTVTNQGCKAVKYVKVNYEVLDEAGTLVDNGYLYAEPTTLEPGMSASFRANITTGTKVNPTHVDWKE
jgi:hypothetical protein